MSDSKRTPDVDVGVNEGVIVLEFNNIWKWRFKALVKFIFVLTLVICISVVLHEDNDLDDLDREHVDFNNFCFVFTLLLLLPSAYESGTSVYFWLDPDAMYEGEAESEEDLIEEYYKKTFAGFGGYIRGLVLYFLSIIGSPFYVLYLIFQICRTCCLYCQRLWDGNCPWHDVSDAEHAAEDAFDRKFGVLVGMLDAWQFTLLIPLAFVIISGSDTKADALINTVAIQFLSTLEDQFIGSLGAEERFEQFSKMVRQYKQPQAKSPISQKDSPKEDIETYISHRMQTI